MLHIAHITDTHIGEEGILLAEMNTRQKFLDTLEILKGKDLHGIILTGDLTYPDASEPVYSWIKEQLDDLDLPYVITPGNHDDSSLMQEIFNLKDLPPHVILTGAVAMRGESLLFLDSSSERMPLQQQNWVSRELCTQPENNILFMHHPPCFCGVPFMDNNYPYKTPDLFQETIRRSGKNMTVFCGHYHVEKVIPLSSANMKVYITPPTMGGLSPNADNFTITDSRTAWREIKIEKQTVLETMCHYQGNN